MWLDIFANYLKGHTVWIISDRPPEEELSSTIRIIYTQLPATLLKVHVYAEGELRDDDNESPQLLLCKKIQVTILRNILPRRKHPSISITYCCFSAL